MAGFSSKAMKGVNSHQPSPQILALNWHQRKNHLDLPLRNAPVEHFKQWVDCGEGSRSDGTTETTKRVVDDCNLIELKTLQRAIP